jgi:hypothetical protein
MTINKALDSTPIATLQRRIRKLRFVSIPERRCNCRDKNGRLKKLYATPSDALYSASIRSEVCRKALKIYQCLEKLGWHISSNIW